jgi:hypothetical protein
VERNIEHASPRTVVIAPRTSRRELSLIRPAIAGLEPPAGSGSVLDLDGIEYLDTTAPEREGAQR